MAQALHLLSTLYGPFPSCYGIGRCSKVGTGSAAVPMAPSYPFSAYRGVPRGICDQSYIL